MVRKGRYCNSKCGKWKVGTYMELSGFIFNSKGTLTSFLDIFNDIKDQILKCGNGIMIASIDLTSKAICDSACHIDSAFKSMIDDKNYLCAASLVRMQMDNALVGWAGLICDDDMLYIKNMLSDNSYSNLRISWERLESIGVTKDMVDDNKIKHDKDKLGTSFVYGTLSLIHPRARELYKKGCGFIHPSASLFKASFFGDTKDSIKLKPVNEVEPYHYNEAEIVTDYLDSCSILLWVMKQWFALKLCNVEIMNQCSADYEIAKIYPEFNEFINLLKHEE